MFRLNLNINIENITQENAELAFVKQRPLIDTETGERIYTDATEAIQAFLCEAVRREINKGIDAINKEGGQPYI